ncbi:Signal recognition particle receptor FtsY [Roseivivax sp. THAF40]|uniref:signal recognition particle-docking protein FtsY n=1 Tax=unclassified Roseivivax TaxID=2639302 RepID=UPI001268FF25|nr:MULTISPECIES: signal recognition particle-docking protein FtsY [unclassified Roseivivax]QFS81806.1 Signal recognition particle receptor FtsY [Roseivivax sp. THAF197b]QFT45606.1 Signal recognition particle receptor FtsY [Roseivivax sp. THAF40]
MSFFGKLKSKLFKSSSKLEEGLDAIVDDGGAAEESAEAEVRKPEVSEDVARTETPVEDAPTAREEAEEDLSAGPDHAEADSDAPVGDEVDTPVRSEETRAPEDDTPAQHETAPEDNSRASEAAPEPAPERAPDPEPEVPPARMQDQAPEQHHDPEPAPTSVQPLDMPAPAEEKAASAQGGVLSRLFGRKTGVAEVKRVLDDDMVESLEELLISADMGVETALRVTANMAEGRMGRRLSAREIKELLAAEIARIMEPVAKPLPLYPTKPQVVLVVGVNGSGKTTTIGKLASQFRAAGKKVVIAAGDTFRAAAVEQLQIWGDRAGVPVLTAPEGSDPASLAFDAMTKAQADGADLLMIDTAGRLQNRADLMEELAKIVRVIRKKDPDAPHNTLLVLDATTGQNALNQVETFQKLADVSGLVMTKLDGTAKGGVLVALADRFGLPIHAIGVGEQIDDLAPFDPEEFAAALTGLAR